MAAYETYGKKYLKKYGHTSGPLNVRKTGITQPLIEIPGYFNGHKITVFKAVFNERDRIRWTLIKNLTGLLEQNKNKSQNCNLPSGLTLQKLLLSK